MPAFAGSQRVLQLLMTALYQMFFSKPAGERKYSRLYRIFFSTPAHERKCGRLFLSPPNSKNHAYFLPLATLTPAGHPQVPFYGEHGDIQQFWALVFAWRALEGRQGAAAMPVLWTCVDAACLTYTEDTKM